MAGVQTTGVGASVQKMLAVLLTFEPTVASTVAWKKTCPEAPAFSVPSDQVMALVTAL